MRLSWSSRFRIRRCVAGGALPCGCSVGAYELRDGATVWVVDEQHARCHNAVHRRDTILESREQPDAVVAWGRLHESHG